MFILNKEEAEKKALAITNEGLHFKGQYLPKESFEILGKKVDFIDNAFPLCILISYEGKRYFISEELLQS